MKDKAAGRVTANQRQLMQYLRAGDWVLVSKIPIAVGRATIDRITRNGWIEQQGAGHRSEIKLTPEGLVALQTPI